MSYSTENTVSNKRKYLWWGMEPHGASVCSGACTLEMECCCLPAPFVLMKSWRYAVLEIAAGDAGLFLLYEMSPNKINKSNAVKKEVRKRLPLCSSSALFCRDVGILAEAKEDQRGSLADDKAVAKSLFLIALAVGSSDSSGEALHLLGSGLKENLSCRLHACKSKCFLCLESAFSALKVIYPYAPISRVNLFFS